MKKAGDKKTSRTQAASRRKKAGKPKRSRRPQAPGALWLASAVVGLTLLVAGVFYLWTLDRSVVRRFESNRFSIPSSVFSRPVEYFRGSTIERDQVVALLRELDYASTRERRVRTGEYRLDAGERIVVRTHEFVLPGEPTFDSRTYQLDFVDGKLTRIRNADTGELLEVARFEPLLLGRFYGPDRETRELVSFADVSERFVPALLAAEDARFFDHPGIDILGLMRAAIVNLRHGGVRQGGSTITQQLVKNLWLTPERTFRRKFNEILMSLLLERHYEKSQILETYANAIYLGQRGSVSIIGVGQASRYYFGKPVNELTWGEAATLAGLIRSPARYNPFSAPERSRGRRDDVLSALHQMGFLDQDALAKAKAETLRTEPPAEKSRRAAYFVDHLSKTIADEFDAEELQTAGLEVYTTVSAPLQLAAEQAVYNGLAYLTKRYDLQNLNLQAALVSVEPRSGRIVAYVGGRNYAESQFDRVSQAKRQIGSLIKPFVFYAAVRNGYPVTSKLSNEPLEIPTSQGIWKPQNYDNKSGGMVTVRDALTRSLNLPTVRIAMEVGLQEIRTVLEDAGFDSTIPLYPALALGALEASPLEVAQAYASLAALGERFEPSGLDLIADQERKVLKSVVRDGRLMLDPASVYVLEQLLVGVVNEGTGQEALRIGYEGDLAGKTGTTSDYRDAWFAGFTPNLVTVVWVGTDDNKGIRLPGSRLALPIWGEYMLSARNWYTAERFIQPPGVEWVDIDVETGMRASQYCPGSRREVFVSGYAPLDVCSEHQGFIERILGIFQ